jgi:4-hydroxybenzoate polyprenyltransferase
MSQTLQASPQDGTEPALPRRSAVLAYLVLLRPSDWIKNVLVLVALVFSGNLWNGTKDIAAGFAFVAYCLLASGFYSVNDALDVESDRRHPFKRRRPVAAGEIAPRAAMIFGIGLIVGGLAISFAVNTLLGLISFAYIALQIFYNLRLKRIVMVDVVGLAIGFVLRAAAGAAAIEVQVSIWLVMCVFFLCLYLGFIKRLSDITSARLDAHGEGWQPPAHYDRGGELQWLLGISATLAIATYLMYALSPHAMALFGPRAVGLALLTPLVLIAIYRFYRRALLGCSDRPIDALFEDAGVRIATILFAVGVLVVRYAPHVGTWLDSLFLR